MNDFSGPIDKKTAKTLLDAYTIQAILHGAERRAKEREADHGQD